MSRLSLKAYFKCAGFLVWAAAIIVLTRVLHLRWSDLTIEGVRNYVLSFGWYAPAVFVLAFAQPVIPLPGSVMAMAAGLAFGLVPGLCLSVVAGTLRGCSQFWMAHLLGREAVEALLGGRLGVFGRVASTHSFWTVFWMRNLAPIPFDAQNLLLGLSSVRFSRYVSATFFGLIPALFLWVYIGKTLTHWLQFIWVVAVVVLIVAARWFFAARRDAARRR